MITTEQLDKQSSGYQERTLRAAEAGEINEAFLRDIGVDYVDFMENQEDDRYKVGAAPIQVNKEITADMV